MNLTFVAREAPAYPAGAERRTGKARQWDIYLETEGALHKIATEWILAGDLMVTVYLPPIKCGPYETCLSAQ